MTAPPVAVRELILAALFARVQQIAWPDLYTERNRLTEADQFPAILQFDGDEDAPEEDSAAARCSMTVEYDLYVSVSGGFNGAGGQLGADLNRLLADLQTALLFGTNQAPEWWAGIGIADIRRGPITIARDFGPMDTPMMAANIAFTVDYWTLPGDPYSPGP